MRRLGALYVAERIPFKGFFLFHAKLMAMKIQIISLFPEVFGPYLNASMLWKAQDSGITSYELINLRDFGLGKRRQVDDTPYGGGDGMLLKPEPLVAAIEHAKITSPEGKSYLTDASRPAL